MDSIIQYFTGFVKDLGIGDFSGASAKLPPPPTPSPRGGGFEAGASPPRPICGGALPLHTSPGQLTASAALCAAMLGYFSGWLPHPCTGTLTGIGCADAQQCGGWGRPFPCLGSLTGIGCAGAQQCGGGWRGGCFLAWARLRALAALARSNAGGWGQLLPCMGSLTGIGCAGAQQCGGWEQLFPCLGSLACIGCAGVQQCGAGSSCFLAWARLRASDALARSSAGGLRGRLFPCLGSLAGIGCAGAQQCGGGWGRPYLFSEDGKPSGRGA